MACRHASVNFLPVLPFQLNTRCLEGSMIAIISTRCLAVVPFWLLPQIRVEELLQITAEVEQLRRRNAELQESNNAMQAREGDLRSALNRAVEESKQARAGFYPSSFF